MLTRWRSILTINANRGTVSDPTTESKPPSNTAGEPKCIVDGFKDVAVSEDDPRYEDLARRTGNTRFEPRPSTFHLATCTQQVIEIVTTAVRSRRRIAVRSGGHCYENFVSDPDIDAVIDLSEMTKVYFDHTHNAFVVEPGSRLQDTYQRLFLGWGVTFPGGASESVAAGGHIVGGGYGPHSRQFGISVDHLYAVEVVVVDSTGLARAVVATRDADDPNRDLWWAHTGAGGGNYGIVTKYFLRSAETITQDRPESLLPKPPGFILAATIIFAREAMTKEAYRTLVRNYGVWHELNSAVDSPYAAQFNGLVSFAMQPENDTGLAAALFCHIAGDVPDARHLLEQSIADITAGVEEIATILPFEDQPWLSSMAALAKAQDGAEEGTRHKIKTAFLKKSYSDDQIDVIYDYLSAPAGLYQSAHLSLQSYGCVANTVRSTDSASPQRSSVMRALFLTNWFEEESDAQNIDWTRRFFRDVHSDTGGVPVPGDRYEGCYINFPDIDMADPTWNTSSASWQELFFNNIYPELQVVKRRWDPLNIFRHTLSVTSI